MNANKLLAVYRGWQHEMNVGGGGEKPQNTMNCGPHQT